MTALSTLRRLLGEATPGPWRAEFEDYPDGCDLRSRFVHMPHPESGLNSNFPLSTPEGIAADATCELIAAMRNALPALLDLVEAADRIYARLFHDIALMEPDEQAELMDYEDKREALERAVNP